ncbi:LytR/AlgR family response regulator transcription factor [Paraclostridium bifermentans]|uniref:LytR/AlgR family response regulator transcription factor n=1 Tax=Paraclostridium bifermentans TaxID=1490 RepID=UPI00359C7357
MLKIAICEDESSQRTKLKEYINKALTENTNKEYEIIEYERGEAILEDYPRGVDIIFLDIQMDNINGMDTARKIREFDENVEIIFITGVWEYVQEGYEVRAYRYLIKPVEFENFQKQLCLCINEIEKNSKSYMITTYKGDTNKIAISSILYIETEGRNTIIHTINETYKSNVGINKLERELENKTFVRCHNSFLINLEHINKIDSSSVKLYNYEVPVSRHKMKELKLRFTSFLGDKL